MKSLSAVLLLVLMLCQGGYSQSINWQSLDDVRPNIVELQFGIDYGLTAQLNYGRSFFLFTPMLFRSDLSIPMGGAVLDDFRLRFGLDIEVIEVSGFTGSFRFLSSMRRFENDLVHIMNFGSDVTLTGGYYAASWYAAAEVGLDRSSTLYLTHSRTMREYFPSVRDGWYELDGGHAYYGVLAGAGLGSDIDLSLRLGMTAATGNDVGPAIPVYLQVGVGTTF